jgi:hypothetical protein
LTLIHSINSEKRFLLLRHQQTIQLNKSLYLVHHLDEEQEELHHVPQTATGLRTAIKLLSGLDINKPICTIAGTTLRISAPPNAHLQAILCDPDLERISGMELRTLHGVQHLFFCCHWVSPLLAQQRTTWEAYKNLVFVSSWHSSIEQYLSDVVLHSLNPSLTLQQDDE